MSDKIIIKGLKVFAYHGVNEEEKVNGQDFIVDLDLKIKADNTFTDDDINATLNYASVKKSVEKMITGTRFNLIETLAEYIAKNLFLQFDKINCIKLTVKKPDAPMKGSFDWVGVKIKRRRKDYYE